MKIAIGLLSRPCSSDDEFLAMRLDQFEFVKSSTKSGAWIDLLGSGVVVGRD